MARQAQEAWDFDGFPTIDSHTTDYWIKAGRMLHRLVKEAARSEGHDTKQGAVLAAEVGANATQFCEALKDPPIDPKEPRKRFAVEWLPRLIVAPEGMAILRFLCALRKHQPTPIPTVTPEEIAKRVVGRVLSKGAIGVALLREEFGDDIDSIASIASAEANS